MKGKVSKTGYRKDSPDRYNDYNVIPSNKISMQDVDIPIYGMDNLGYSQMMMPGSDYIFPGSMVMEIPAGYHRMPDGTLMRNDQMKSGGDAFSRKVSKLMHEGYKQDQALAIAYSMKRKGKLQLGGDHMHNRVELMKWGKYIDDPKRREQHMKDVYWNILDDGYEPEQGYLMLKEMGAYGSKNRGEAAKKAAEWGWDTADVDENKIKQWAIEYDEFIPAWKKDTLNINPMKKSGGKMRYGGSFEGLSPEQACTLLIEGQIYGEPLTDTQRMRFAEIAGTDENGNYPETEDVEYEEMVGEGYDEVDIEQMKKGGIYIKPSKRGTFTAAATKHGMGVQEFARHVLANKDKFTSLMVKKANFARNASKWNRQLGGPSVGTIPDINIAGYDAQGFPIDKMGRRLTAEEQTGFSRPLSTPRTSTNLNAGDSMLFGLSSPVWNPSGVSTPVQQPSVIQLPGETDAQFIERVRKMQGVKRMGGDCYECGGDKNVLRKFVNQYVKMKMGGSSPQGQISDDYLTDQQNMFKNYLASNAMKSMLTDEVNMMYKQFGGPMMMDPNQTEDMPIVTPPQTQFNVYPELQSTGASSFYTGNPVVNAGNQSWLGAQLDKNQPYLADEIIGGVNLLASAFEGRDRKEREKQMQRGMLTENLFGAKQSSRGDYETNTGYFRPNQMNPTMYRGYHMGGSHKEGDVIYMEDGAIDAFLRSGGEIEYID